MMGRIRVLLAEDHAIVREGIRAILEKEADIEVVADASDGREAVKMVAKFHPNVVLTDISMPGLNGLEATRQIKQRYPETKVLVLTMHETEEHIFQILQAGASGYLVKHAASKELIQAIRTVYHGDTYLSPSISTKVIEEYIRYAESVEKKDRFNDLTNREREVLQLIAEGNSNREIAERLHISVKTVATHKTHLKEKLNIHKDAELIRYAIRKGIIE
ncbi:MAG: response regulator transcription factor [Anaerolineaceae bacterium]|nr:response regulator transcription factor [Anaerolineaceae bacterium]